MEFADEQARPLRGALGHAAHERAFEPGFHRIHRIDAARRLRRSTQLLLCRHQHCQRGYCVHQVHAHDYCRQNLFRFLFAAAGMLYFCFKI